MRSRVLLETVKELIDLIRESKIPSHMLVYEPHSDGSARIVLQKADEYELAPELAQDHDGFIWQIFGMLRINVYIT